MCKIIIDSTKCNNLIKYSLCFSSLINVNTYLKMVSYTETGATHLKFNKHLYVNNSAHIDVEWIG